MTVFVVFAEVFAYSWKLFRKKLAKIPTRTLSGLNTSLKRPSLPASNCALLVNFTWSLFKNIVKIWHQVKAKNRLEIDHKVLSLSCQGFRWVGRSIFVYYSRILQGFCSKTLSKYQYLKILQKKCGRLSVFIY